MHSRLAEIHRSPPLKMGQEWHFDLDTGFIWGNPVDARESSTGFETWGLAHETFHWLQFVGTTFGAFMALTQKSIEISCFDSSQSLPQSVWAQTVRRRFGEEAYPIVPISRTDFFLEWEKDRHPDLDVAMQCLYDLWWLKSSIYSHLGNFKKTYKDPSSIISLALRDSTNVWNRLNGKSTKSNHIDIFPVKNYSPHNFQLDGEFLTTYDILEAQSFINEFFIGLSLSESNTPQNEREFTHFLFRKYFSAKITHPYNKAIKKFFGLKNSSELTMVLESNFLSVLFCIACDSALNPPIPPFVAIPKEETWDWMDIHPVYRFIRLKEVLRLPHDRLFSLVKDAESLRELQIKLCDVAKITPPPYCLALEVPGTNKHFDWNKLSISKEAPEVNSFYFYSSALKAAWTAREKHAHNFIIPGETGDLKYDINNRATKEYKLPNFEYTIKRNGIFTEYWSAPPVIIDKRHGLQPGDIVSKQFAEKILKSSAYSYLIDDILFRRNLLSFKNWPEEVANNGNLKHSISQNLEKNFRVDGWCKIN